MANLIPPDAKKAIVTEYWIRVATVWLVLVACAIIVVGLLKVPTFVLVQSQLRAFTVAYDSAREKEASFTEAQEVITEANRVAGLLSSRATSTTATEVIAVLDRIAGESVTIRSFAIERTDATIASIAVTGTANTRAALSNFSKDIEAHEFFGEADLPISNLAKDRDIGFSIEIIPSTP